MTRHQLSLQRNKFVNLSRTVFQDAHAINFLELARNIRESILEVKNVVPHRVAC